MKNYRENTGSRVGGCHRRGANSNTWREVPEQKEDGCAIKYSRLLLVFRRLQADIWPSRVCVPCEQHALCGSAHQGVTWCSEQMLKRRPGDVLLESGTSVVSWSSISRAWAPCCLLEMLQPCWGVWSLEPTAYMPDGDGWFPWLQTKWSTALHYKIPIVTLLT